MNFSDKQFQIRIIKGSVAEIFLITLMLLTFPIHSDVMPIIPFREIPPIFYFKGLVWLLGLCFLPGLLILRATGSLHILSNEATLVLAVSTSLVIVGFTTLLLDYIKSPFILPFILVFLISFELIALLKNDRYELKRPMKEVNFSFWGFILSATLFGIIIVSCVIQCEQQYPFLGDVWSSIHSAVEVVSGPNRWMAYQEIFEREYPVIFGFILGGLSYSCGLPVANTHVFLTPIVALNSLAFYCMLRLVFKASKSIGVMATIIYTFTGGLGWLTQILVYHGTAGFWALYFNTEDIYLTMSLWNFVEFNSKSLALVLGYTSLIAYVISIRLKNPYIKAIMVTVCSLTILFSFFIHMVEPLIIAPVLFIVAYLYEKGRSRMMSLFFLVTISCLLAYLVDLLTLGYYSWLITFKLENAVNVSVPNSFLYAFFSILIILILLVSQSRICGKIKLEKYSNCFIKTKYILITVIAIIYICGLYFWLKYLDIDSSINYLSGLPWYVYFSRYSIIGILGLVGLLVSKWSERWCVIASFWSLIALVFGSIWWGSRINAYMFPMIALFASIGIDRISKVKIWLVSSISSYKRIKFNLKPLIIVALIISSSSFLYTTNYFLYDFPRYMTEEDARTLSWIYNNVPQNVSMLVPPIWKVYFSINCFSDRQTYLENRLPTTIDSLSFENLTQTLKTYNIRYAISSYSPQPVEGDETFSQVKTLLSYSKPVFRSGDLVVFELPNLQAPSSNDFEVGVVDKQVLGFSGNPAKVGWIDDSFKQGWTYRNVNSSSNGEVLKLSCHLRKLYELEPGATIRIPLLDTSMYPYLIIKYRNGPESEQVSNIVTLINQTGYPKGFLKNYNLPFCREDTFNIFLARLPENQTVAEVWIWMRNYENLNGTASLDVDYIGFTSMGVIPDPQLHVRFLSMAIPALWPINYSLISSFDELGNTSVLVSKYDKSVENYIEVATNVHTFIFFNVTASFPSWGTGWRNLKPNITSGFMNGKRVLIVGIENIVEQDLVNLAQTIYKELELDYPPRN